jgi:hypothetical protein
MVQCIDDALTKQNYLDSIRKAGFKHVETLRKTYPEEHKKMRVPKIQQGTFLALIIALKDQLAADY